MKKTMNLTAFLILLSSLGTLQTQAADTIRIVAPYAGRITNEYANSGYRLNLKDTGWMSGLFYQQVNPEDYQYNLFLYHAPTVNFSRVMGVHWNGDFYVFNQSFGKAVAGLDVEDINIKLDAGSNIAGLNKFQLYNNVLYLMPRVGYRFVYQPSSTLEFSLFPYVGLTVQKLWGDVTLKVPGPTPEFTIDITDSETFNTLGLNFAARLWHFVDLQAKYMGGFRRTGQRMDTYSTLLNVGLTREYGLTYRFKSMDITSGSDIYHLLGFYYMF